MTAYRFASVLGQKIFYREAGPTDAPTLVLLHGFPSSSHMFRELIPRLAERFHIIAPDYPGFGYSAAPDAKEFSYTFDSLAAHISTLLFDVLGLKQFSIYVQDYGGPIGYRIASQQPQAIEGIVVQNANAYKEGLGASFDAMKPFWAGRNAVTEQSARKLLAKETTIFQYTHGASNPELVSPDSYTVDQFFLERPGNDAIQLDLLFDYQFNFDLYERWQAYFRAVQPCMLILWGQNDPIFTVEGAKAYVRDIPMAEFHLLDSGHFALEDSCDLIALRILGFLERMHMSPR